MSDVEPELTDPEPGRDSESDYLERAVNALVGQGFTRDEAQRQVRENRDLILRGRDQGQSASAAVVPIAEEFDRAAREYGDRDFLEGGSAGSGSDVLGLGTQDPQRGRELGGLDDDEVLAQLLERIDGFTPIGGEELSVDVAEDWIKRNTTVLTGWMLRGEGIGRMAILVGQELEKEAIRKLEQMVEDGDDPQAIAVALQGYGLNVREVTERADEFLQIRSERDSLLNDQTNQLFAQDGLGYDSIEEMLAEARRIFQESGNAELAAIAERDDTLLFMTIQKDTWRNVVDEETHDQVAALLDRSVSKQRSFQIPNGKGLVREEDWAAVGQVIGGDPEANDSIVRDIFDLTSRVTEDAGRIGKYVSILLKDMGVIEDRKGGKGLFINVETGALDDPASNSRARMLQFGGGIASQFERALQAYGRPELAMIAMYDPALAQRIYQNGSPQSDEELFQVNTILGKFSDQDLNSIGWYDRSNAQWVDALTSVGGPGGSGPVTVNHQDPATLEEALRDSYRSTLFRDPTEAELASFVANIQEAERSSAVGANAQLNAYSNVWTGEFASTSQTQETIDRYAVDYQSRLDQSTRATSEYRSLYQHLPQGVSEGDYAGAFQSKVGQLVGQDDVGFNLDAVKAGMVSGDPNRSVRQAFVNNATTDETLMGRIASQVLNLRRRI